MNTTMPTIGVISGGGGYTLDVYKHTGSRYDVSFKPSGDTWLMCFGNHGATEIFYHDNTMASTKCKDYRNTSSVTEIDISTEFTVAADGTLTKNMNGSADTYVMY